MTRTIAYLLAELNLRWRRFLLHGLIVAVLLQVLMLLALVFRFQALPNYLHVHDWPGNIARIVASTPSWTDIFMISVDEWLLEIGQMNYDYGTGLSVWSLNVVPSRVFVLMVMGAMVSLCFHLLANSSCKTGEKRGAASSLAGGTVLVAMTNATMSWVVCCATPSWVVGLAMLGLGVSTSLALESLGLALSLGGFLLLLLTVFYLGWRNVHVKRLPHPAMTMATDNA